MTLQALLERVGVKVKPLEWGNRYEEGDDIAMTADSEIGAYGVSQFRSLATRKMVYGWRSVWSNVTTASSLDEAKAAAQADYEQRILSALIAGETP